MKVVFAGTLLAGMLLGAVSTGAAARQHAAVQPGVARSRLQPFIDQGRLAGATVLITDKDRTLDFEAIGFSDLKTRRPRRKDDLFWIASTSKPFVAVAVMMLVEQGKLDLDKPVTTWLPEFRPSFTPLGPDGKPSSGGPTQPVITLRQLLSHTSGLPGVTPDEGPTLDARPLAERVSIYGKMALYFPPGAAFSYGNADINVAAYLVERVSGMPYDRFLRTHLLDPLGMRETSFCPSTAQLRRLAHSYTDGPEGKGLVETPLLSLRQPLDDCAHRYPIPAGGLFTTAGDLARFARMMLNSGTLGRHRYLSPTSIDAMTRNAVPEAARLKIPQSEPPANIGYGLGWGVSLNGDYFHPGTGMSEIRIDPTRKVATIILLHQGSSDSFTFRTLLLEESDKRYAPRP